MSCRPDSCVQHLILMCNTNTKFVTQCLNVLHVYAKLFQNQSINDKVKDTNHLFSIISWIFTCKYDLDFWPKDLIFYARHVIIMYNTFMYNYHKSHPGMKELLTGQKHEQFPSVTEWSWPLNFRPYLVHNISSLCATHLCKIIIKFFRIWQSYRLAWRKENWQTLQKLYASSILFMCVGRRGDHKNSYHPLLKYLYNLKQENCMPADRPFWQLTFYNGWDNFQRHWLHIL